MAIDLRLLERFANQVRELRSERRLTLKTIQDLEREYERCRVRHKCAADELVSLANFLGEHVPWDGAQLERSIRYDDPEHETDEPRRASNWREFAGLEDSEGRHA